MKKNKRKRKKISQKVKNFFVVKYQKRQKVQKKNIKMILYYEKV